MDAKGSKEEVLVETEFLFGLRKGDRYHEAVKRILGLSKKGLLKILVLSSAVVEVKAVLASQGLKLSQIEEACSLMDIQLLESNIEEYVPVTLADIVIATRLRSQLPKLTFFDSLHISTAKRLDKILLSNDPIYRKAWPKTIQFKEQLKAGKLSV
jgi:predicted nucleic acid-binding protein